MKHDPDFWLENDWYWYLHAHCRYVYIEEKMMYSSNYTIDQNSKQVHILVEMWIGNKFRDIITVYPTQAKEAVNKRIGEVLFAIAQKVYWYQCEYYRLRNEIV